MGRIRLSVLLFCAFVSLLPPGCASKHRSDQQLITDFQTHKSEFNTLLEMFRADRGLIYFSEGRTLPDNPETVGVSRERLVQYQRLFELVGLLGMAAADRHTGARDEVWFFTSTEGPRTSTFKHYAYVSQPKRGIVQDLDQSGSKAAPYRHIENNWYLALDDAD